ncbi:hypothetical protein E2C01_057798 [Portunus trituberculatus]|uniref:Uncharacterized protein n=1 Tax=Portunus trituberculatus TaxID=210409 RepID=A0A5B7H1G6_PORTR|nr:hypothetical protein [Portunus trituberculatus]
MLEDEEEEPDPHTHITITTITTTITNASQHLVLIALKQTIFCFTFEQFDGDSDLIPYGKLLHAPHALTPSHSCFSVHEHFYRKED